MVCSSHCANLTYAIEAAVLIVVAIMWAVLASVRANKVSLRTTTAAVRSPKGLFGFT